jgi:hypothetical protein
MHNQAMALMMNERKMHNEAMALMMHKNEAMTLLTNMARENKAFQYERREHNENMARMARENKAFQHEHNENMARMFRENKAMVHENEARHFEQSETNAHMARELAKLRLRVDPTVPKTDDVLGATNEAERTSDDVLVATDGRIATAQLETNLPTPSTQLEEPIILVSLEEPATPEAPPPKEPPQRHTGPLVYERRENAAIRIQPEPPPPGTCTAASDIYL